MSPWSFLVIFHVVYYSGNHNKSQEVNFEVVHRKILLDNSFYLKYNIRIWKNTLEISMLDLFTASVIFGICMFGCALTAFHLGRREGIENTVQYLIDEGVLEVSDGDG